MQGRTPSLLITVSGKLERWASSGDEKSNMEKGDSDSDEMEGLRQREGTREEWKRTEKFCAASHTVVLYDISQNRCF